MTLRSHERYIIKRTVLSGLWLVITFLLAIYTPLTLALCIVLGWLVDNYLDNRWWPHHAPKPPPAWAPYPSPRTELAVFTGILIAAILISGLNGWGWVFQNSG